ncbi:putative Ribosomal protein S30Ae-family protein, sigma-54 modulation protein [Nitrospira sp. KM1]|uniref:ribosome hibernation-promoting factor, HPF/YfiA family n=1 Tax=Nitrospira sp. KM1 TaxID=1936990 RepID=UPI0013A77242|nr:ribosome-associated translation inhibitor RaiA [Nitrospira sp. KM1]BCA56758.1 putative Ribosomal protein S30Ae-family protein, sigma-54 modulation protein [Nitrospira sp. KM1]
MKITGRHLAVTEALTERVRERCSRLLKYGISLDRMEVILSVNKLQHIAEAVCSVGRKRFQAKTSTLEMYVTIDQLVDRLETQIRKEKDKQTKHKGRKRQKSVRGAVPLDGLQEPVHVMKPKIAVLSTEAARKRLDERPGALVVFTSVESGKLQILQRGDNGQVVLIDP